MESATPLHLRHQAYWGEEDSVGIRALSILLLPRGESTTAAGRDRGGTRPQVTGKIYHRKFNKPPSDPEVQKRLVHRSDDTAEVRPPAPLSY